MNDYCKFIDKECIHATKDDNDTWCGYALTLSAKSSKIVHVKVSKMDFCPQTKKNVKKNLKRNRSGYSEHRDNHGYYQ